MLIEISIDIYSTSSSLSRISSERDTSTDLQYPYPNMALSGEIMPGWLLNHPLLLEVEIGEEGEYIVSYDAFDTYGVGDTPQEAAEDFISMLIDLYEELDSDEDVLSSYFQTQLERLRQILSRS